jgi:hypothetical protein
MTLPRPIQSCHSRTDIIRLDGPFKLFAFPPCLFNFLPKTFENADICNINVILLFENSSTMKNVRCTLCTYSYIFLLLFFVLTLKNLFLQDLHPKFFVIQQQTTSRHNYVDTYSWEGTRRL